MQSERSSNSALREQVRDLCDRIGVGLVEREEAARLLLLGALAGEHVLLLGPPGTAKSELARRLRDCLADTTYFERLLTKFSVPEEIYGPLSIKRLEQDEYYRLTEGYLPSASVAFLDEIFNANSAILNALLTLLNERAFDNGTERVSTPLVSVVAASNHVPESAELAALYDRFLFRYQVEPVSDGGFSALLDVAQSDVPAPGDPCGLTVAQLEDLRRQASGVGVPESVRVMLTSLRRSLAEKKLYVSDRRWTKIVRMLRVAALCEGRNDVTLVDCWLMVHCLWNRPEQAAVARDLVHSALRAVLVDEPRRYEAIAAAFHAEVTRDEAATEQVCDEAGHPLWYDESGAAVTDAYERVHQSNSRGDLLFVPPPGIREPIKSGFTLEELWKAWFSNRPNGMNKLEAWSHNPANHVVAKSERKRCEQPRRYSNEHIAGRRRQVEDVLSDVRDFLEAIVTLRSGTDSLWVPAAQRQALLADLNAAHDMLATVEQLLHAACARIDALPRSNP